MPQVPIGSDEAQPASAAVIATMPKLRITVPS
jgi:hypothetical protein